MNRIVKFFFAVISLVLILVSCKKDSPEVIAGKWESLRSVSTELLSDPEDSSSVIGFFIVDQAVHYVFNPDGTFEKNMSQTFKKCDFLRNCNLDEDSRTMISNSLSSSDSEYIVHGKYVMGLGKIRFEPESYVLSGIEHPFSDAVDEAPFLVNAMAGSKYTLSGDRMLLTFYDGFGNQLEFNRSAR